MTNLQVLDDRLNEEEEDIGPVSDVDVGGGLAELDTSHRRPVSQVFV